MKKLLFILLLLITHCSLLIAQPGWVIQPFSGTYFLFDVHFADVNTGWAVGSWGSYPNIKGVIIKTTNGGTNWNILTSNIILLSSVHFADNNTGWVVGDSGKVFKTTNGGTNWIVQPSGTNNYLFYVYFIDNSTGWAVGYSGAIIKTTNGGSNWFAQTAVGAGFTSIKFVDYNTGWISGTGNTVCKTTNGGNNWIPQVITGGNGGYPSVFFVNSNTGWVVALGGTIHKTINGGANWVLYSTGTLLSLSSIYFVDENTGWVCGDNDIIRKTTNGGINWFSQGSYGIGWLNAFHFVNSTTGWVVGDEGAILKTTNGGNVFINNIGNTIPDKFTLYQNYPNPFNPLTKIKFDLPRSLSRFDRERGVGGMTTLRIFDIIGREITTLVNEKLNPGIYEVTFDGRDLTSGIYFYKLESGNFREVKRMLMIK